MKWARPFSKELADALLQHDMRKARERYERRLDQVVFVEHRAVTNAASTGERAAKSRARYVRALEMRREGKLLREIGAELGVSSSRVRTMIWRAESAEHGKGYGYPFD